MCYSHFRKEDKIAMTKGSDSKLCDRSALLASHHNFGPWPSCLRSGGLSGKGHVPASKRAGAMQQPQCQPCQTVRHLKI